MEVSLPQNQESQLNELALKTGRGTDELVQEAVARLLAHNEWFRQHCRLESTRLRAASSSRKRKWTPASSGVLRRIRWAPTAADDLQSIRDYLREHHPSLTQSTIKRLYDAARSLRKFPNRGRNRTNGEHPRTRHLAPSVDYRLPCRFRFCSYFRVLHGAEDRT